MSPTTGTLTGFTIDERPVTVEDLAARLPTCLLCDGVPVLVGCFVPYSDRVRAFLDVTEPLIGPVRPGKQRVAFYALCRACAADPATTAAVEARFLGETGP